MKTKSLVMAQSILLYLWYIYWKLIAVALYAVDYLFDYFMFDYFMVLGYGIGSWYL